MRIECTKRFWYENKQQRIISETHKVRTKVMSPIFFPDILNTNVMIVLYRMSQKEWTKLRESVPYVELYRYNPKHLYPKFDGYGDNGQRSLKL